MGRRPASGKFSPAERRDRASRWASAHEHGLRWFTEGRAGNIVLAADIVSENAQTNRVIAGVTGPKRRLPERPAGFPDLSMHIVDMFSAGDKVVTRLVWRGTPASPYGMPAASRRLAAPTLPHARRGRQSSGNTNDTGSVRPAKAGPETFLRRSARHSRAVGRARRRRVTCPAPALEAVHSFPAVAAAPSWRASRAPGNGRGRRQ